MLPSARLFRSRWAALLWAGGVVWFAVDFAQSAPTGNATEAPAAAPEGPPLDEAQLKALSNAIPR